MTGTTDTDTITIPHDLEPGDWRKAKSAPRYYVTVATIPLIGEYAAKITADYDRHCGGSLSVRMDRVRVQYRDGIRWIVSSPFSDPCATVGLATLPRWNAKAATVAVWSALAFEVGERFARVAAEWRDSLRAQETAAEAD